MGANMIDAEKVKTGSGWIPSAKAPAESVVGALSVEDEVLLNRLLNEPFFFVDHPDFPNADAETQLFGGPARLTSANATRFVQHADAVCDAVRAGERVPTLTHSQEQHLFQRYNYARFKVAMLLEKFAGKRLTAAGTRQLLAWGHRALVARSVIVRLNLPLVLAMAKRTKLGNIDFNEMISEGNMALLRSVEKFDCSRGFKFSTYSCRAILKSFSRVAMRASRYRGTFPTEFDPAMERSDYLDRRRDNIENDCVAELKDIFVKNLAGLSEVEATVIRERFALTPAEDGSAKPKTLEQVGNIIGVTKERVRQIQNNALKKMRTALEERYLAA
jgi:RNA polymerase sigma factor (sigma-70 family)